MLRAIRRIWSTDGLTQQERVALLVLWRFLGDERKPIGPRLLGFLVGVSQGRAKQLLARLRREKFIGCAGQAKAGRGHVGVRWITKKLPLPSAKKRGAGAPPSGEKGGAGAHLEGGAGAHPDLGVGHTDDPPGSEKTGESSATNPAVESGASKNSSTGRTFSGADVLRRMDRDGPTCKRKAVGE